MARRNRRAALGQSQALALPVLIQALKALGISVHGQDQVSTRVLDKPKPQPAPRRTFTATAVAVAPAQPKPQRKARKAPHTLTDEEFAQAKVNRALSAVDVLAYIDQNIPDVHQHTVLRGRWLWIIMPGKPDDVQKYHMKAIGFSATKRWGRWEWYHPCGVASMSRGTIDPEQVYTRQPV